MKLFFLTILLLFSFISVHAIPSQDIKLDSFVIDQAGILSPAEISQLNEILNQVKLSGKAEFVVLIVDNLNGEAIESYSLNVVQGKLGNENNNGLLLLISMEDRAYRFESGRGIEAELPDILLGRIGRDILAPSFQKGEYGAGIIQVVSAINNQLEGKPYEPVRQFNTKWIFYGFIFLFWFIIPLLKKKNRPKDGSRHHSNSSLFAAAMIGSMLGRGGSGGFGGGGFGGGGFGGGGAGGGW